jgi:diguanylate cyclase (GGDEF)-like protein
MRGVYVRGHVFDLVSIEGTVATEEREASQDEYVLSSNGHVFSAIYRHSEGAVQAKLSPKKILPPGSRVRLKGICIVESFNPSDNRDHDPFDVLLNSADDITVIARPSWLSVRNLSYLVSALLLIVLSSGGWGWSLTRKVRRQSKALAIRIEAEAALERRMVQIEQRRSLILENINGSETLPQILLQITELVTFQLNGAPCWCELRDGLAVGTPTSHAPGLRQVEVEIAAGSGPVLGSIRAELSPEASHSFQETKALEAGSRLATLAIENRRLYDDLLHRSEHDLLTDIPNRFRMEQQIDKLMQNAGRTESAFGLIYIDLDRFKQINDRFGHQIGDLFLQEVARRMELQLRTGDMLARIGGDEFVALLPIRRSRSDAEEIAARLERCFDEPFEVGGLRLDGAASIGLAIYPEDGTTKEELQRSADAAMYEHKQNKRDRRKVAEEQIAS